MTFMSFRWVMERICFFIGRFTNSALKQTFHQAGGGQPCAFRVPVHVRQHPLSHELGVPLRVGASLPFEGARLV